MNSCGFNEGMTSWYKGFDDPFLLPSSESMPDSLDTALDLCLFLYYLNPQYRQASSRVVRHFITDFDYPDSDGSKDEKDSLDNYLHYNLQLPMFMADVGDEWACLAGETKVPTRDGVFAIRDLAGRQVDVLSKGGIYRRAEFKSYGMQELMEVEFSDGRKIYATPEHEWEVLNCSGKAVRIRTTELNKGHRIRRTVAQRPAQTDEYRAGVRHGFVFGDGSKHSKNSTMALFCGKKDLALLPYFDGFGNPARRRKDRSATLRISGLPGNFKQLPSADASAEYWYGFVCGFLAADGTVDKYGCAMLTQCSAGVLEAIEAQLPRIGMAAGPIRSQRRVTCIGGRSYDSTIYFMTLLKRFMHPDDFILEHHQKNFIDNRNVGSNYGEFVGIRSVERTDRFEEVFCCVEMETHTIVVENGVLTGQCYGNAFARIHFPFDRFLVDPRVHTEYALDLFGNSARFLFKELAYEVPDPINPGKKVRLKFRDRKSTDINRIKLRLLNPRYITIQHNLISGSSRYVYRFEPSFVDDVKKGRLWVVNDTPMSMLRAVSRNQDFLFDQDSIFHFRAPTVSGVSNCGWGIPGTIANYRNIHQLQVYRKIDEAVGLDYLLPFRLFSPSENMQTNDMVNTVLLSRWSSEVRKIIMSRRANKFAMHSLPFPVNYQEFGADGKQLTPKDLMEYQTNTLLDGLGYPRELFTGSLQYLQVPTGLRLFENSFLFVYIGFNNLAQWVVRRVRSYLNQPPMQTMLQRPSLADSLERKQLIFQLAAMGEVSRETGYDSLGIDDVVGELKKRMEEDAEIQREQFRMQQQMQKEMETGTLTAPEQQMGDAGQVGGMPVEAPGGMTPMDVSNDADQLAQYWLSIPSDGERSKAMQAVRAQNENLYAMAKTKMEDYRRQGASQGRQQANASAQQSAQTV